MNRRSAGVIALAGGLGWVGLIWLGLQLYRTDPPTAGFDLELLLRAGRAVADGRSPYDPAMLAGAAPVAERLFYSYPPLVAQVMALFAAVPSPLMYVGWAAAAVGALALVTRGLARRFGQRVEPGRAALVVAALVPLLFPFAIGLLFGNLDVFFPAAFGVVLLGVTEPRSGGPAGARAATAAGGAATIAAIAKLQPAAVGLWLLARAPSARVVRPVAASALLVFAAVLVASVAVGGTQPWLDYLTVVRAGSGADLVDPRNAGPAAQTALLVGGGGAGAEALARMLQIPVTVGAVLLAVVAAVRVRDPVESLGWAVTASLVVLPVTWYHYPAALIPFAVVAWLRAPDGSPAGSRARGILVVAGVVAAIAIAWLPLLYVAVALVHVAVRMSGEIAGASRPEPARVAA